jgi:hypothetical protein
VSKKAADHIRERTEAAIKLRERDVQPPPGGPGVIGGQTVGPAVGTPYINELPPFAEDRPPLPDSLPAPKPLEMTPPKPLPPPGPGNGNVGARPLPPLPTWQGAAVAQGGTSGLTAPGARPITVPTTSGVGEQDYFRPSGTVSLPPRGAGSSPRAATSGGGTTAPAPLPPLPAGTGLDPVPIPPVGTALPVPPPTAESEFGPPGRVAPLPVPPLPERR